MRPPKCGPCVAILIAEGVHPRPDFEALGHSQISWTMDSYSHILPALHQETANRKDAVLGG